jgi:tRNA threonylcarbamoyladenosine biosynthesis protein TsaB
MKQAGASRLNILVIDTASQLEIIAACAGADAVETSTLVQTSHSATLMRAIDGCLEKVRLTPSDLDCIGVGVGPGSFTGIRIAVSTARMFAQVLGKPLVGIKTQLLYAVSIEAEEGDSIMVAFDAKKGRVFGALYRRTGNPLAPREIVPPGDYPIDVLIAGVDRSRTAHLVGDGTGKYADALASLERALITENFMPAGKTMCDLVRETYSANPGAYADYNATVPCYARKSDAETAKEAKQ